MRGYTPKRSNTDRPPYRNVFTLRKMLRSGSFNFNQQYQKRRLVRSIFATLMLLLVVGLYINALIFENKKPTVDELRNLVDEHFQERVIGISTELRFEPFGDFVVTELVSIQTKGQVFKHGLVRALPLQLAESDTEKYPISIELLSRKIEHNGHEISGLNFEPPSEEQGFFRIPVADQKFDLKPGRYQMLLQYRVKGLRDKVRKTGKLYWNLSGDWLVAVQSLNATLTFPSKFPLNLVKVQARLVRDSEATWRESQKVQADEIPLSQQVFVANDGRIGYELSHPAPILPAESVVLDIKFPPDIFE